MIEIWCQVLVDKIWAVLMITQVQAITEKKCECVKKFVLEIASVFEGGKHGNGYHDYGTPCC